MSGDTLGDLILRAIELTPLEFSIEVDPHKLEALTAEDYLEDMDIVTDPKVRAEMIAADTIITVRAYTSPMVQWVGRGAGLEEILRGLVSELGLEARR
jgi:hypothetical protein